MLTTSSKLTYNKRLTGKENNEVVSLLEET